jgi:hypothetical protein
MGGMQSAEAAIARAHAAIDALRDIDYSVLEQHELGAVVVGMHELQNRIDAHATRAAGAFDSFGDPGRASIASALAWSCRRSKASCRAAVARARALRSMPATEVAYEHGAISTEHVRLLAAAARSNAEAYLKAEDELIDDARRLRFDQLARRVEYFRQLADPDGVEAEAVDAHAHRQLHCSRTFEQTVRVDGSLDPIGGTIVKTELERLEQQLFEADWAEARARVGDVATASDLRRTAEQRRADALVEMARRSAAKPADAREARILLTVLVGYETFAGRICQLADGTTVTPGQVASLLPDRPAPIDVERAVFGGPSRVLDVGSRQRLFTGATRRAVEVRDLECTKPSCDEPYHRCEVDHIQPYALDGPTIQDNGRLRCPRHHDGRRRERPPPTRPG